MKDTNAPRPVARHAGRAGTASSLRILASGPALAFDLRPWATAHRYRVQLDAAHGHETDPAVRGDGRDFIEIPCLRGKLYAIGADTIGAWTSTRGVLAELLALDSAVRVRQRGDAEAVVAFPVAVLDTVARVLRPLRLSGRTATAEDRARLARTAFRGGVLGPEGGPGRAGREPDEEPAEVRA